MSAVTIRVELPAYSYSFQIQADAGWSIKDVKAEIQRTCTGEPRADGQRLVWRGRFLKDEESVQDIWKVCRRPLVGSDVGLTTNDDEQSPSDARIVHLSVHPSAWMGSPPTQQPTASSQPTQVAPQTRPSLFPTESRIAALRAQLQARPQPVAPAPAALPLEFIQNKHDTATHVLIHGHLPTVQPQTVPRANPATRAHAQNVLEMHGYSWPSTLDEDYPPPTDTNEGVKYEQTVVE